MKALLVLFDKQDRVLFRHPFEAESMEYMLPALYLELFNNNTIHAKWKHAFYFHILTLSDDAVAQKPVTAQCKLDFICSCKRYNLTPSETNVAWELRSGLSYKAIGTALNCSPNTVNTHVNSIYDKLRVNNRHAAMNKLGAGMKSI